MHNTTNNVLDTDRIGGLLIKLTAPAFLGLFVQALYNVVNTIFIGQFVGPLGVAGLSIVFPLQMFVMGLGTLVGIGGASLISRFIGMHNISDAEHTIGNGITAGIMISIVVTIIILPFGDFWLRLIGASDAVLPYARDYLVIIIAGTVFTIFSVSSLSFVRAEGNARVGMMAMVLGAIFSIVLDALFVIPLHMGVKGAALATVISQIVSMLYVLSYYIAGGSYLKIHVKNLRPKLSIFKAIFAIGISACMQTSATSFSMMLLISMVIRYGGDMALGGFGIVERMIMFAILPSIAFAQGLQPVLGYNYGAKRHHLALKAISIAIIISTLLSLIVFLIIYIFAEPLMKIFTNDPQLISTGAYAARRVSLGFSLSGVIMVGQMVFQAIGKAGKSFLTAISRPVLFLMPLVLIMSSIWGLDGVYLSMPAADLFTFILVVAVLLPVIKEFRRAPVTQNNISTGSQLERTALDMPD